MRDLLKHSAWAVWLLLMLATGLSWWLATSTNGSDGRTVATIGLMLVAFVKIRFVGIHFMELGHAPLPLRLGFEAWVLVACGMIIGVYLAG